MSEVLQDDTPIHEGLRVRDETMFQRVAREFSRFFWRCWLVGRLALFLVPLLFFAMLTLDLPLRIFDALVGGNPVLSASNWLSRGEGLLILSVFFLLLVTRSYGADFATKVQSVSWVVTALLMSALLIYLAPVLTSSDWPSPRFAIGFLASWYLAQIVAINFYDLMRGGSWWRAPLYGALFGFGAQALVYFPVVYWETQAPWLNWIVVDFCMKALLSVGFLGIYAIARRPLRPYLGHNGMQDF